MSSFVNCDIAKTIYPSISENLLTYAISYVKSLIGIAEEEHPIIWHSKKILLFQNSEPLGKKDSNEDLAVLMG